MKSLSTYAFLVYFFINALFIFKYGKRLEFIPTCILLILYSVSTLLVIFLIKKSQQKLMSSKRLNKYFLLLGLAFFIIFISINLFIDGNDLNVDRWSAMESAIIALLNGEFPYSAEDHMGGRTSNFPGLLLIGIPFYLLGDVGFLQPFIFLCILFVLHRSSINAYQKIIILILLIFSPSYLWEITVKSDLMSNIIITILFIALWHFNFYKNYFKNPIWLAFILSILVLTRGIVLIPLSIFLFKDFFNSSLKTKFIILIFFLVFVSLLIIPIIMLSPNYDSLKEYNPIILQTRQTSYLMQVLALLMAVLASFKTKSLKHVYIWSFVILCFLLFPTFIFYLANYGIKESILDSVFDLSYLGMIIPFAIILIALNGEVCYDRKI